MFPGKKVYFLGNCVDQVDKPTTLPSDPLECRWLVVCPDTDFPNFFKSWAFHLILCQSFLGKWASSLIYRRGVGKLEGRGRGNRCPQASQGLPLHIGRDHGTLAELWNKTWNSPTLYTQFFKILASKSEQIKLFTIGGRDPKPCVVAGVLLSRHRMLYPPLPLLTSAPAPASQLGAGSGWAQSISAERDSAGGWQPMLGNCDEPSAKQ